MASSALDEGGKALCADRLSMTSDPAKSLRMTTWSYVLHRPATHENCLDFPFCRKKWHGTDCRLLWR